MKRKEMNWFKDKKKRKIFIWVTSVTLALAILVGVCAIYLGDYYRADMAAIEAFVTENEVPYTVIEGDDIVFKPENCRAGLIFYPGGKVEYTAYLPLMEACANEGILCVLVKMPFNLAVLDSGAAEGIPEKYPEVKDWYIGGHSLGGSMAASYLSKNGEDFKGLILLGSYSTDDLSDKKFDVVSIYGSEDRVMNREKYGKYLKNLPKNMTEIEIVGGCHAYFGMYGRQDGDGEPTISADEQIRLTAKYISEFIN